MATKNGSQISQVQSREELIYLLTRASELEHGLACIYLFAAYSLKSDIKEGRLTFDQAVTVKNWKKKLASVAIEEMLHLAQVNNLLTAIGGSPNFRRTNFPLPVSAFPFGIKLSLEPFSLSTIERFICYEIPEDGILSSENHAIYESIRNRVILQQDENATIPGILPFNAEQFHPEPELVTEFDTEAFSYQEPFEIDFKTVGEFYHKIETGFKAIPEDILFIGPVEAQANARFVDLSGQLIKVFDRQSACKAIEMIIEQGEAPTHLHPDCHFVVFDTIRKEYLSTIEKAISDGISFDPVRIIASNPMTRFYDDTSGGTLILNKITHLASDLFNVTYDTMLQMLLRFFAHTDETEDELALLSHTSLRLMTTVIRPLGEALTKMSMGNEGNPELMAGPGFGYNRDIHLLPHKKSAWIFFAERLSGLVKEASLLAEMINVPSELKDVSASLSKIANQFIS